jgi:hypothetical protein
MALHRVRDGSPLTINAVVRAGVRLRDVPMLMSITTFFAPGLQAGNCVTIDARRDGALATIESCAPVCLPVWQNAPAPSNGGHRRVAGAVGQPSECAFSTITSSRDGRE